MKTPLIILCLCLCINSYSQIDSANKKLGVTLQARDIEYLLNFTGYENRYEFMDSLFISKLAVSSPPTGTTNVAVDSVKAKHWLAIFERIRLDAIAIDQSIFGRLKTALNNTAFTWLTVRITRSDDASNQAQSDIRQNGRKRARKELDEQ